MKDLGHKKQKCNLIIQSLSDPAAGESKKKKSTHEEDQKDSAQVHRCSKNTGDKYMFCIYLYILYVCMMSTLCLHRRAAYGPRV